MSITGNIAGGKGVQAFAQAFSAYYLKQRGMDIAKALRAEMPLVGRTLQILTPPFYSKRLVRDGEKQPTPLAPGKNAVARDVKRAVKPLRVSDWHSEAIRKIIRRRDKAAMQKVLDKSTSAAVRGAKVVNFTPDLHERMRNRRGGVSAKRTTMFTFDAEAVGAYIKRKQRNVGMARDGWSKALTSYGKRPVSWVARHGGRDSFIDDKAEDKLSASILISNRSPWAKQGDTDRIRNRALSTRARALVNRAKRDEERRLRAAAKAGGAR